MSDQTNPSHLQSPPLYNFYFADQLNVSQDRKDSRSSSVKSQKLKDSLKKYKIDLILEETKNENKNVQQSLLEGVEQNEFIPRSPQNQKNANEANFISEAADFLNQFQQQKVFVSSILQEPQNQPEHQTSFLLDSASYKEICIKEKSKKVQFCSHFDVNSSANIQEICSIHEKPFEIVCIEDKTLVCSHCAIFGQHKSHSLAPLNQISEQISVKKSEINQIISDYKVNDKLLKALQLKIKEKSFCSQFTEKIELRKKQTQLSVKEHFRTIRQFLQNYEQSMNTELNKLYEALESKIAECIRRTCLDSNTAAFERWQKDALTVIQQVNCEQVSMKNRVNIFLSNFSLPQIIPNLSRNSKLFDPVSLQVEGQKYYREIEEQLNLSITEVIKTVDLFNVNISESFDKTIKSLISFQCDSKINDIIDQNRLVLLDERLNTRNSFDSVKESMKHIHNMNLNSHNQKPPEDQLASTVVSFSQSTPIHLNPLSKSSTKFNSPVKNTDPQKQKNQKPDLQTQTFKKSLKYKRYQTLQDMKKLQQNIKHPKSPAHIVDAKSQCGQKKRRNSPCLKDMVSTDNQKLFMSSLKPRLERCTSKDSPTHKRSPSDEMKINLKNTPMKNKQQKNKSEKNEDPLKTLENYENSETQTLDLSECNLSDTEILYFVQKASKVRKIKHLKLSYNLLSSQGFEKIIPYLSSCSMINLSSNRLSELAVDLILRRKEKLGQLRMINLANNRLNERKIKEKMEQFKKLNIVVTL